MISLTNVIAMTHPDWNAALLCCSMWLTTLALPLCDPAVIWAAEIKTIVGNGEPRHAGDGMGNPLNASSHYPFGLEVGPDGALYWAEFGSHTIRRLDLKSRALSTYAGVPGQAGYRDGDKAQALFNEPHEIRFDALGRLYVSDMKTHTIRRIDAESASRLVSTVAGTGQPGFQGDNGPATQALLDYPISVVLAAPQQCLICDIRNHRIRQVDLMTGLITTVAGTGERGPIADGAPVRGTPLNGPRTLAVAPNGDVIIVLREGSAVYRWLKATNTLVHVAGTGKAGYSGDGADARKAQVSGPKGVTLAPNGDLFLADTESHTIRAIRQQTGIIETVVGTGKPGSGPDGDPQQCALRRPHGVSFGPAGELYIGDSDNHVVRVVTGLLSN
jgi:DNA-binding beta-propeller fold protein YncE